MSRSTPERIRRTGVAERARQIVDGGAQPSEHGEADGYPHFQLVEHGRGTVRRLRNLIFATLGKPPAGRLAQAFGEVRARRPHIPTGRQDG
ncbi:hypothetical protein ACFYXM_33980 [Streptomyces sp. NPDC002476]|uniref:hypothetical protein n=1 Tax=Streptomyces sp. NPDC002476 TaxID=3364648 RepID=UPI0036B0DC43